MRIFVVHYNTGRLAYHVHVDEANDKYAVVTGTRTLAVAYWDKWSGSQIKRDLTYWLVNEPHLTYELFPPEMQLPEGL